jgi:type III restriction enzyme
VRPEDVRKAYFAQKRRAGGVVEQRNSTTGASPEDRAAYQLIMREKEKLLSFDEPTAFIFSHSALKEGWDNPNVFQICTLREIGSEVEKRQVVGRGVRLAVNQTGERAREPGVNALTVVANESYESFVEGLQKELAEAFGADEARKVPKPTNARERSRAVRKPLTDLPPEFKELWERIKHRTRYRVKVDSVKLVEDVVKELDRLTIEPPRVDLGLAAVVVQAGKDKYESELKAQARLATLQGRFELPNLMALLAELMERTTPPVRLTRRTLWDILNRTAQKKAALANPQDFATKAVQVIKDKAADQLVEGIQYEKDGTWYEMELFEEEVETVKDLLVQATKSIYNPVACDSQPEVRFAEGMEKRKFIKLYVKLPNWFRVKTPVGNYNPDWAVVKEQVDPFGEPGPLLYLVCETKSTTNLADLYNQERQKILCGKVHFEQGLDVEYKVVDSPDSI